MFIKGGKKVRKRLFNLKNRVIAFVLLVVMVASVVPANAFAGSLELITNGDFESNEDAFEGWNLSGEITAKSDNTVYADLNAEEGLAALQSDVASADNDEYFKFSFDVKLSENAIFTAKALQYAGTAQSEAGDVFVTLPEDIHSGEWVEVEYTFRSAEDVTGLGVYFDVMQGTAQIDNVSLKCLYRTVKYTADGEAVSIENADFSKGTKSWEVVEGSASKSNGYIGDGIAITAKDGLGRVKQDGIVLESDSLYELHYYVKATNADAYESAVVIEVMDDGMLRMIKPNYVSGNSIADGWEEVVGYFATGTISETATIKLNVESADADAKKATVYFDELLLTKMENQVSVMSLDDSSDDSNYLVEGITSWNWYDNGSQKVEDATNNIVTWTRSNTDGTDDNVNPSNIILNATALEAGKTYRIAFDYKMTGDFDTTQLGGNSLVVWGNGESGYTSGIYASVHSTNNTTKHFEFVFTPTVALAAGSPFRIRTAKAAANSTVNYELSNITLAEETTSTNLYANGNFGTHLGNVNAGYTSVGNDQYRSYIYKSLGSTFSWGDAKKVIDNLDHEVVTTTEHGNAFQVTLKQAVTNTDNLNNSISLEVGKTYNVSFWYKVTGGAKVDYRFDFRAAAGGSADGTVQIPTKTETDGTDGWKQVTFQYTATENNNAGVFGLLFSGSEGGVAQVADVKIEDANPQTEDTTPDEPEVNEPEEDEINDLLSGIGSWSWSVNNSSKVEDPTNNIVTWSRTNTDGTDDNVNPSNIILKDLALEAGKTYRISFDYKVTGDFNTTLFNGNSLVVWGNGETAYTGGIYASVHSTNNTTKHFEFVFTPSVALTAGTGFRIRTEKAAANSTVNYELSNITLVEETASTNLYTNGNFGTHLGNVNAGYTSVGNGQYRSYIYQSLGSTFSWGDAKKVIDNLDHEVVTTTEHGNAFQVTLKQAVTNTDNLNNSISLEVGKTYNVSFWYKVTGGAKVDYRFDFRAAAGGSADGTVQVPTKTETAGTDGWKQVTFQYTATENNNAGVFGILFSGSEGGVAQVADVKIVDANPETEDPEEPTTPPEEPTVEGDLYHLKNSYFPSEDAKTDMKITEEDSPYGLAYKIEKVGTLQPGYNLWNDIDWEIGTTYDISYWTKGSASNSSGGRFQPGIRIGGTTYYQDGGTSEFANTKINMQTQTTWVQKKIVFTPMQSDDATSVMAFMLSTIQTGDVVYLADVRVIPRPDEAYITNGYFTKSVKDWEGITTDNIIAGTAAGAEVGNVLRIEKSASESSKSIYHVAMVKELVKGTKYTFKFRMRNDALVNSGSGVGSVYFVNSSNQKISEVDVKLYPTNGVWTDYVVDFTAEQNYSGLRLCLNMAGTEKITYTFADFSLNPYTEIVKNGNFADGLTGWTVNWYNAAAEGSMHEVIADETYGNVLHVKKSKDDTNVTDAYLTLTEELVAGQMYQISLKIKNTGSTSNGAADGSAILLIRDPATTVIDTNGLGGEWKEYTILYTAKEGYTKPNIHLRMAMAKDGVQLDFTDYYFADVKIERYEKTSSSLIQNGDFSSVTGTYPDKWGAIDDSVVVTDGVAKVTKGITTLSTVYENVGHVLKFDLKADETAREALTLRLTSYADSTRVQENGMGSTYPTLELKDTDDWQTVEIPFSVAKGVTSMDISLYLAEGVDASFEIDNASIELDSDAQLNFDFEAGIDEPISWTSTAGILTRVYGGYNGEGYAAKITNAGRGYLQSTSFALKANTVYELSFWVKANQSFDSYIFPTISQKDADGNPAMSIIYDNTGDYRKESSTINWTWLNYVCGNTITEENPDGWQQVRVYFRSSEDAAEGTIKFDLVGGAEEVWFDHVRLEEKANEANWDFENTDSEGNIEGWFLTGVRDSNPVMKADTEVYHSGKQSLYINTDSLVRDQHVNSSYLIPITATDDTRVFEYSYWVSSRNADFKSIQLNLDYYDEDGIKIWSSSVDTIGSHLKGDMKTLNSGSERSEWSKVTTRVKIPVEVTKQEIKYVALVFSATQGAAEVWLDDITFKQVEDGSINITAQNDFHAVDQDGNFAEVTKDAGTLVQKEDDEVGYYAEFEADSEGYITYRTPELSTAYTYGLRVKYKSDYNVDVQIRYHNYQEKEYEDIRVNQSLPASADWTEQVIEFVAPSTTYTDFLFGFAEGGVLDIAEVTIIEKAEPATEISWKGDWISYLTPCRDAYEYTSSYYRKEFVLEEEVTYAPFQYTGDDKIACWVNGELIYDYRNDASAGWSNVQVADIASYLKEGKNVIAFEVRNEGAYSAMLFDGIWDLESGKTFTCISDRTTLVYPKANADDVPEDGWNELDYDSDNWNSAVLADADPWGKIYYDASLYIDNSIQVKVAEGEGDLVNDLVYEFAIDIKLENEITSQVPLNMVLWRKNSTKSLCNVTPTLLTNTDMREWPVGEWFTVKMSVELPDYIEDGNYTLQLSDKYFLITNEDMYDNRFISFKVVNDYVATETVTKVEVINGAPTFTINGEPASGQWFTTPFSNIEASLDTIANSGIETYVNYQTMIGRTEREEGLWQENGTLDFDYFDKNINTILATSSDATVVVSIGMYAPDWWVRDNIDECAATMDVNGNITSSAKVNEDGSVSYTNVGGGNVSYGSTKWIEESSEVLTELINHMKTQDYYPRVVGIRLLAGNTYENLTYGTQSFDQIPDYSPAALEYFKKWAEETYGTIENLREAWNDPDLASFDDITFPTFAELAADGGTGMLYNPVTQQKNIDFRNLLSEMTADAVVQWAKVAKEAVDNKLIVGAYYGYLFSGAGWTGGGTEHSVIEEVISSEYLDFFAAPIAYNERQLGESPVQQSIADSMRAYGKLYLSEQDNRTVIYSGGENDARGFALGTTYTLEDTILQEKRDMVYNFVNGNGAWLFGLQGDWINDDQIYEFTSDAEEEYNFGNYISKDLINDIAIILPQSNITYYRTSPSTAGDGVVGNQDAIASYMYKYQRKQLNKIGAGYDVYALSTLTSGNMPEHKINIFFTPYVLTQEEREAINTYCKKNGQINIFFYLSGYGDEEGYDLANMEELTGFKFEMTNQKSSGQVIVTNDESDITQGLLGKDFGAQVSTTKYYLQEIAVSDAMGGEVLGVLNDTGKAGLVAKDMGDWTSIYTSAPCLTEDIYRNLLEMSDSHIYSYDSSDIVWSNSAYVGVHSSTSGNKTIYLDGNYAVYDVFEEKYVSLNTNVINYVNKVNDTHLFRLTQANTYSFLTRVKGGNGTTSVSGLEQIAPGSSKTVTITPDEGYMIKSVTVNGEVVDVPENNTLTFEDINENYSIVVKFKRVPVDRVLEEDEVQEETVPSTGQNTSGTTQDDVVEEEAVVDSTPTTEEKDDYEEIWENVLDIINIPTWIVWCWIVTIVGLIFLILFLKRKKEQEEQKGQGDKV